MRISDWSSDVCSSDLLATTLLVGSTALAQQAPAQQAAAEITQPSVEVTMHPNYAAAVGRSAYAWGWPMVNMFNRRATITQAPKPGLLNGILPVAPRGRPARLSAYIDPPETFVTRSEERRVGN